MTKKYFTLNQGEKIILQENNVAHDSIVYDDLIVLTTERLILVDKGLFGKIQGNNSIPFDYIRQAIGKRGNGEEELELYIAGNKQSVKFSSKTLHLASLWAMAINDRNSEYADKLGYEYYDSISYERALEQAEYELRREDELAAAQKENEISGKAIGFVGDVAKNIWKSKRFTPTGVAKSVVKATVKQNKQSFWNEVDDNSVLSEFKDTGIEMKNAFRESFGLKPIPTSKTLKKEKQDRIENRAYLIYLQQIEDAKKRFIGPEYISTDYFSTEPTVYSFDEEEFVENDEVMSTSYTVDQQIEMLSKLKSLLDAGLLTQEEFDTKKKEIIK